MSLLTPTTKPSIEQMLCEISAYTTQIMLSKSAKLSYQLAYDTVYQLCKQQHQSQTLQSVFSSMRNILPIIFDSVSIQTQTFLNDLTEVIVRTDKNMNVVKEMCLFIDLNYCKIDLKRRVIQMLHQIFLEELFKKTELIMEVGRRIAKCHLSKSEAELQGVLKAIKIIDYNDQYFAKYFIQSYLPVLTQTLTLQCQTAFTQAQINSNIQQYIQFAHQKLQLQQKFLNKFWPDNKHCTNNKNYIMKEVYLIVVTKYKQRIYENHKEKLFNQLTLIILELFRYNVGSGDVEKHAEWYNGQIKNKLQGLKLENNSKFIDSFCEFYNTIMTLLQDTHNKFDIHYRSRFAFQQWINEQKLQMPIRLNDYIRVYCLSDRQQQTANNNENNSKIEQNICIVFVLMKQKNLFEKTYRRQLIERLLENYGEYNMVRQQAVIKVMAKQCSEQFVKNIWPIVDGYTKRLQQQQMIKDQPQLRVLLLNSQSWPYDEKHITDIIINKQLTNIVERQTVRFNAQNKDKTLYWHPIVGVVVMKMRFLESKWQGELVMSTCMANVMLHFNETAYQPFQLKSYCLSTGYKLDQLYQHIRKLIFMKVLVNHSTQDNYVLAINQHFSCQHHQCDIINIQLTNKFQSKPLEELKADRKFMVEAIIVKLMKRLKSTDKSTLLKQAAPLIEKRGFSYNAKFVESAIERLIEKEFIRDYEDGNVGYIA